MSFARIALVGGADGCMPEQWTSPQASQPAERLIADKQPSPQASLAIK
jgi:hypothetical protein